MVLSDTSEGDLGWKKWLITGWAFIECFLFSGLLYGWGSLNFVLKMEGIYSDLCDEQLENSTTVTTNGAFSTPLGNISSGKPTTSDSIVDIYNTPCKQQDQNMALCYTIAVTMFGAGSFFAGLINFRFGIRTTRLVGSAIFTSGALMMAFVSKEYPWLMFPGFALLSLGGLPVMLTNLQVAYLFTAGASSVVGLMNGGFTASTAIMLSIKIAHQHGFTRRNMFIMIALLHCLVLISTFCFLPKYFIVKITHHSEEKDNKSVDVNLDLKQNTKMPSLTSCLLSSKYITHLVWFAILCLRFQYFIGTLNQYLTRMLHAEDQVSFFTDVFFYIVLSGVILSFLTGAIYDRMKRTYKDGKSPLYRELMPSILPLGLTSVFAIVMSILVLIPVTELLYVIFLTMTMFRAFLFSSAVAYIRDIFPSEYFAVMYGVLMVVGSILATLQYAFFTWANSYNDGQYQADMFLLFLTLLTFVRPIYWWIICNKDEHRCHTSHLTQFVFSLTKRTNA